MKQDRNGVRTAQDLERKYNLSGLSAIQEAVELQEDSITKVNNILNDFINVTTNDLKDLHNQIDGNIMTWFYEGEPSSDKKPENEWLDYKEKTKHIGDLYYDKKTGYAYRYTLDSESDEFSWIKITDSDVTEALAVANAAKDTADEKRRVFVVEPYTPYDVGDIWLFNDSDMYRCISSRTTGDFESTDWVIATKYTDDTAANNVKDELDSYKIEVSNTYVSQSTFTTANNEIKGQVRELSVEVGLKNKIFITEPLPPYNVGDAYIINDKIYICNIARTADEEYYADDWILDIDNGQYINQATLDLTAKDIRFEITNIDNKYNEELSNINDSLETKLNVEDINPILSDYASTSSVEELSNKVEGVETEAKEAKAVADDIIQNGVGKVTTTSGIFDNNGLTISKTGANTKTNINENGMVIYSSTGDSHKEMQRTDSTGTYSENVSVRKYLVVGNHTRFEDFSDGTGAFYLS